MENYVLTKDHPAWEEFIRKLLGRLSAHMEDTGCDRCREDFTFTKRILENMPGIDVDGTIDYLRSNFGSCDCDIADIGS